MQKAEAYRFLEELEAALTQGLPDPQQMLAQVRQVVSESKVLDSAKHMRQPEDAFLHRYAFPIIFEQLKSFPGMDEAKARESLLSEYFRNMQGMCSGTPARQEGHPFNKTIGKKPSTIFAQWKGESGPPLKQSCPDFALRVRISVIVTARFG